MSANEQELFSARLALLPDTAAFAQVSCERCGIERDDAMRLALVIEELFTNTVEYGYRGEGDAPIRIGFPWKAVGSACSTIDGP